MSFIDLMGDTVWSTEDIAKRSQRIVLNQFTRQQIRDLDDMVTGASQGMYVLTQDEELAVQSYSAARLAAREARLEAERDNELLKLALQVESFGVVPEDSPEELLALLNLRALAGPVEEPTEESSEVIEE